MRDPVLNTAVYLMIITLAYTLQKQLWLVQNVDKCTNSSQCGLSYKVEDCFDRCLGGVTLSQLTASSLITAISTSSSVSIAPDREGNTPTIVTAKLAWSTLSCMGNNNINLATNIQRVQTQSNCLPEYSRNCPVAELDLINLRIHKQFPY